MDDDRRDEQGATLADEDIRTTTSIHSAAVTDADGGDSDSDPGDADGDDTDSDADSDDPS